MAALGRFAPLTASDVGQRIVMDKVAVSRAVAGLMKRGLVERATDRADRRRASLRLSARGRAMHARIVPLALGLRGQALRGADRRGTAQLRCPDRPAVHPRPDLRVRLSLPCGSESPCYKARTLQDGRQHLAAKAARRPPATQKPVLVLNGPNLNMLGKRQPEIYGRETLADVEKACRAEAERLGLAVEFAQSNHEGVLVDRIQAAREKNAAIVINAGAYTHTSVALLDALNAAELPAVEVHLSNIYKREAFRHHSYISPAAVGVIAGLGSQGYLLALQALARLLAR